MSAYLLSIVSAHDAKNNDLSIVMTLWDLLYTYLCNPKDACTRTDGILLARSCLAYPDVQSAAHGQVRRRLCLQLQA